MQGVSTIIVTILLLMISVSLASFAYVFFTQMVTATTETGSEAVEQISTSLLAGMKIDSLTSNTIYIRNTGKVNLTQFSVYVNDVQASSSAPSSISPGAVEPIALSSSLNSGDIVKVTSGQGAIAIKSFD
jgi:FlaG/FlaF family flagellin (archaellin)